MKNEEIDRSTEANEFIDSNLYVWWEDNQSHAAEVAQRIVECGSGDTYFHQIDFDEDNVNVGIIVLRPAKKSDPELLAVVSRLKSIFGGPVEVTCYSHSMVLGDLLDGDE